MTNFEHRFPGMSLDEFRDEKGIYTNDKKIPSCDRCPALLQCQLDTATCWGAFVKWANTEYTEAPLEAYKAIFLDDKVVDLKYEVDAYVSDLKAKIKELIFVMKDSEI